MSKPHSWISSRSFGTIAGLLGAATFSIMALFVRLCGSELRTGEILLTRALAGAVILAILCRRQLPLLLKWNARFVWLRGLFGGFSVSCYYWNLRHSSLGAATVLVDLAPILVVVISALFLNDRPHFRTVVGILLACAGVATLASPKGADLKPDVILVGIAGATSGALAYLSLKRAASQVKTSLVVLAFSCALIPVALLDVAPFSLSSLFNARWPLMGVVVTSLIAQLLMTASYRALTASAASALGMTAALWAIAIDVLLLDYRPTLVASTAVFIVLIGIKLSQGGSIKAGASARVRLQTANRTSAE